MVFQVCYLNTGLLHYTLSLVPAQDFHLRSQSYSYYILLRQESYSEKHTERAKKVCLQCSSCRLRQTMCMYFPSEAQRIVTLLCSNRTAKDLLGSPFISFESVYNLTHRPQSTDSTLLKHILNKL